MVTVNAATLFDHIKSTFDGDRIPMQNMVSNLSDSTNYMRGKLSGLEKRLRDEVPHLLDIDGDICHHAHGYHHGYHHLMQRKQRYFYLKPSCYFTSLESLKR